MQNELTYIGPESQGPHYLESGKRPYGIAFLCNVMYGGKVIPAQYYSTTDTFRDATGCRIEPVCWWHLPAAAPSTEREWWMAQEWKVDHEWQEDVLKNYAFREGDGRLYVVGSGDVLGYFHTTTTAKEAAYQHWVEAGRP